MLQLTSARLRLRLDRSSAASSLAWPATSSIDRCVSFAQEAAIPTAPPTTRMLGPWPIGSIHGLPRRPWTLGELCRVSSTPSDVLCRFQRLATQGKQPPVEAPMVHWNPATQSPLPSFYCDGLHHPSVGPITTVFLEGRAQPKTVGARSDLGHSPRCAPVGAPRALTSLSGTCQGPRLDWTWPCGPQHNQLSPCFLRQRGRFPVMYRGVVGHKDMACPDSLTP